MEEENRQQNPLIRVLEVFGNLFVLNVLFLICCIPVITVGASTTALYAMCFRMIKNEEGPIVRGFFGVFKKEFKNATLAWVIAIIAFAIIWAEFLYVSNFADGAASFYSILLVVESIIFAMILPFLFPLIARFENTLGNYFKNAFLLSLSNLWAWIKVTIAWAAPIILSLRYPFIILSFWYLWMIIIFGLIAYGTSHTMVKVFDRVNTTKEQKQEQEKTKAEDARKKAAIREKAMFGSQNQDEEPDKENKETDSKK